jgi:transposase-like protein
MRLQGATAPIGGAGNIVEVDETYVGGKPRKLSSRKLEALSQEERQSGKPKPRKRGRGTDKTPVVALVDRNGAVHSQPVEFVDGSHLTAFIKENVDPQSIIVTDEFSSYYPLKKDFWHETVNHSGNEFAKIKGDLNVHVNTAESYFSLLKRGFIGSYHKMSKKHLHRYCSEFDFRWERRKMADDERMVEALRGIEGKRLSYYLIKGSQNAQSQQRHLVEGTVFSIPPKEIN